jgi:hypothetical protein
MSDEPPLKKARLDDAAGFGESSFAGLSAPIPTDEVSSTIEIDAKGDLVLKVGTKSPKLLRVCSKNMAMVSKVFDALLGPRFREGQTQHDSDDPLSLPDDDPNAMAVLCKLAHFKITKESEVKALDLAELVFLCDKYDCIGTFGVFLRSVLARWLKEKSVANHSRTPRNNHQQIHLMTAFAIAFLINDTESFWTMSNEIIKSLNRSELEFSEESVFALLPSELQGKLCTPSHVFKADVVDTLVNEWIKVMRRTVAKVRKVVLPFRYMLDQCPRHHERTRRIAACNSLLPKERDPGSESNGEQNAISRVHKNVITLTLSLTGLPKCSPNDTCLACKTKVDKDIRETAAGLDDNIGYLCLGCIKQGKYRWCKKTCVVHRIASHDHVDVSLSRQH